MKIPALILALALSGCACPVVVTERHDADGSWTRTILIAPHFACDPVVTKADLPPGVHVEGVKGTTVVDVAQSVIAGAGRILLHLVGVP